MNFARQFLFKDNVYEMRLPSRGYYFVLDPPLPVNVLEGEIKGDAKKPIAGYVATPWAKYPPGLAVPAAPDSAEAKAGGGGGGAGGGRGRGRLMMRRVSQRRLGVAVSLTAALAFVLLAVAAAADDRDGGGARGRRRQRPPRPPPRHASANVRIVFTVLPSTKKATVQWGKKRLGVIGPQAPLIVQRPRDSGPLDVVVRAEGCLPVQTRAYTFEDSKVAVKVTPIDQKNTLHGYREEVPATDGGVPAANPDGGAFFSR